MKENSGVLIENSNIHELIIVSTTTKGYYFYVSNVIINDIISKTGITCMYQELLAIKVPPDNFSWPFVTCF